MFTNLNQSNNNILNEESCKLSSTIKYNKSIEPLLINGEHIVDTLSEMTLDECIKPILLQGRYKSYRGSASRNYKRIISQNTTAVELNEIYAKIDYVPGLKTTLYEHQKTAVQGMLEMELCRSIPIKKVNTSNTYNFIYNSAVLSEPVGSGKTIDILSLILLNKIPRVLPDIMNLDYPKSTDSMSYILRKFKKFIRATIIFVGTSVMKQWENAIKTFTNLKLFSINSVKELTVLINMMSLNTVDCYDIILVKNGKITRNIELPDGILLEDKNKIENAYIYNIIANFRSFCWSRVVIDDFDTIKLPSNACIINGLFTWYISSTRKFMDIKSQDNNHDSASKILSLYDYGCSNIMMNNYLFYYLNIRNATEYIKSATQIPSQKYYIAIFNNPNEKYIGLLSSMDSGQARTITEMLNGDAIGAAAEAAGIKTSTVADIFEKILGDNFKDYRFAGDLLSFIEHVREEEYKRRPMSENKDKNDKYAKKDLLSFREIEYKYPGVNVIIDSTNEEYSSIKKTTGLAIQRVKDNIKHGNCPVCSLDLQEAKDIIIVKCCSAVFCGNCGIKAQNRGVRSNGICSNCRTHISIRDMIYISDEIDLNKIENEEFEDEKVIDVKTLKKSYGIRTKYNAIIDIINGDVVTEAKRVDMHIPNMMKGSTVIAEPKIRKVLIFANYDETLDLVIKELKSAEIHFWHLMGSMYEINTTATEFTNYNGTCALVINSTRHCSGLNLQTSTDLIFTHYITDPAIESQVVGRGHRLGRKTPLNIWYLQYKNEYINLSSTHSIRYLEQKELDEEKEKELNEEKERTLPNIKIVKKESYSYEEDTYTDKVNIYKDEEISESEEDNTNDNNSEEESDEC
jgi:hypothetical protein